MDIPVIQTESVQIQELQLKIGDIKTDFQEFLSQLKAHGYRFEDASPPLRTAYVKALLSVAVA